MNQELPVAAVGTVGSSVSLLLLLQAALGANLNNFTGFYLFSGTASLFTDNDFSYYNPSNPEPSYFTVNGQALADDDAGYEQGYISANQLANTDIVIGDQIDPSLYVDAEGAGAGDLQYDINTLDPSLAASWTGTEPAAADVVASAKRFAALYTGVLNDNDCHSLASDVAAAAGAAFNTGETGSTDPSQNESSGFWRVVYRGSDGDPVSDWQTLVQPGDIVRMAWTTGNEHTATVLSVNSNGSITVFDNGDDNVRGQSDIGVHTVNYDKLTIASSVTIYRLSTDGYYLINSDNDDETLTGTTFNNEFDCGTGTDIVSCGPADDLVNVNTGSKTIDGGGGFDSVSIPVASTSASFLTASGAPLQVVNGFIFDPSAQLIVINWSGGSDTLDDVADVQFADQTLAIYDAPAPNEVPSNSLSDFVWRSFPTGVAESWLSNGSGFFYVNDGAPTLNWQIEGSSDFGGSGGGDADILWRNTEGGDVFAYLANGSGGYTYENLGSLNSSWQIAGFGEFSGGDLTGIIWRNENGATELWQTQSSGSFAYENLGTVSSDWQIAATGDLTGDGLTDILWRSTATGDVETWITKPTGGFTYVNDGSQSAAWQIAGIGDFTGDGKGDILWRNTQSGDAYLYLSNGSGGFSYDDLGVVSSAWQIEDIGHFSNNGLADILWRNSATGDDELWLTKAGVSFTYQNVGAAPTNWTIAA